MHETYILPIYQQWQAETLQQGRQEGQQSGKFELVIRQLTRKVGELEPDVRAGVLLNLGMKRQTEALSCCASTKL